MWNIAPVCRVTSGSGCPACSGYEASPGNNLLLKFPKIAKELKNGEMASSIPFYSSSVMQWVCSICNRLFTRSVRSRTKYHSKCPYCTMSRGEFKVMTFLENGGYVFRHNFRFAKTTCARMPFDFVVWIQNIKYVIEFNGQQHYVSNTYYAQDHFKRTVKNDRLKREFCKSQNIPLLDIPFYKIDDIDSILREWLPPNH